MKPAKKLYSLLLCLLLVFTSGCEFRNIDLRMFVVALGVDAVKDNPGKCRFSFRMALPSGDPKSGEEKSMFITEEAATAAQAIRQLKSKVDKELDFSHCKVLLYGEEYARRNIQETADWAVRRRDMQLLLHPAVAKPTAEAVMSIQSPAERIAGNALYLALSEEGTDSPYITHTYSFDLDRGMTSRGKDPVMPVVEAEGETTILINKTALLDKSKVVDILAPEDAKLFNLLRDHDLSGVFSADVGDEHYELNITGTRSSFSISTPKPDKAVIFYKLDVTGNVEEGEDREAVTKKKQQEIEQSLSQGLSKNLTKMLEKVRDTGVDPLGFGLHYYATHWNNQTEEQEWKALYPNATFEVKVNARMKSTGFIR